MNTLEDDGVPNNDDLSNQSNCLDTISKTTSISEDELYQISDEEAEDDASWSDYEVDSDDDYGFYNDESHVFAEKYDMLSDEATEVIRKYGEDSIIFCGPPEDLEIRFGPVITGIVYLIFPISSFHFETKHNLSSVWGFDPSQPVVVRLRAMMHLFSEKATTPIEISDYGVTVYQGNEPLDHYEYREVESVPSEDSEDEINSDGSENQSNKVKESMASEENESSDRVGSNEDEKPNSNSIETQRRTNKINETGLKDSLATFRLGTQIKKISEEFLLANLRGSGRKESILTLSLTSSSEDNVPIKSSYLHQHQCPQCTFINTEYGATCCIMCGGSLLAQKIAQNACNRCKFVNSAETKKCRMCGEVLMNCDLRNPRPNVDTSSKEARGKMLHPFLKKAHLGGRGVLACLYAYLNARIPQLHRFCVNCDHTHIGILGGLNEPIRPSVCRRDLCSWAFTELGVGSASAYELASTAEVVDLLLAITTAAATSDRSSKILDPFPLLVNHNGERYLDPDEPDYLKARDVISKLPSMQQIVATNNEEDLDKICAERGEYVQGVFRWIISSCSAHLVSLSGDRRLASMGTSFQFLMYSASPEREQAFATAKRTHGSFFAFHGSPIENWHSILRKGVKNCSGTSLQLHGASYGPGVYLSPNASASLGYSKVGYRLGIKGSNFGSVASSSRSGNQFISGEQVKILALCEIIDDGNIKKTGSIWVVANDEHIVTRFLFVFLPQSPDFNETFDKASRCNTTDTNFQSEISTVMEKIKESY